MDSVATFIITQYWFFFEQGEGWEICLLSVECEEHLIFEFVTRNNGVTIQSCWYEEQLYHIPSSCTRDIKTDSFIILFFFYKGHNSLPVHTVLLRLLLYKHPSIVICEKCGMRIKLKFFEITDVCCFNLYPDIWFAIGKISFLLYCSRGNTMIQNKV